MREQISHNRLREIRLLADALPTIEYQQVPDVFGHSNSIAEVGADGKWVRWDMRCCLSDASCDFLAHGKQAIYDLLAHISALENQLATAAPRASAAPDADSEDAR